MRGTTDNGGSLFLDNLANRICEHAYGEVMQIVNEAIKQAKKTKDGRIILIFCQRCDQVVKDFSDVFFCKYDTCSKSLGCRHCFTYDQACNECGDKLCSNHMSHDDNKYCVEGCQYTVCQNCQDKCYNCERLMCGFHLHTCEHCQLTTLCPFCKYHWCHVQKKFSSIPPEKWQK